MVNEQIVEYIRKTKEKRLSDEEIKGNLLSVGWQKEDVDAALAVLNLPDIPLPTSFQTGIGNEKPQVKETVVPQGGMWDAFEHIIMFVSLYTLATSITILLNYYVDLWFPSFKADIYGYSSYAQFSGITDTIVIGCLSAIIVSLPIFAYLFVRISSKTLKYPELRMMRSRKALIYLTLIITFIILFINVISLVYNFLHGNVTVNFVLHFLVYIGVSGLIFHYYLSQVQEDRKLYE